jgi:hypothetical protein
VVAAAAEETAETADATAGNRAILEVIAAHLCISPQSGREQIAWGGALQNSAQPQAYAQETKHKTKHKK